MKTNREIDALIAEHVMGWSFQRFNGSPVKHWYSTSPCPKDARHPTFKGTLPNYSTDIAAAWVVVTAVHNYRSKCLAYEMRYSQSAGDWLVEITETDRCGKESLYVEAEHEQLPLAICLAALKAKGVDYE